MYLKMTLVKYVYIKKTGNRSEAQHFIDLANTGRWLVSFIIRPFYSHWKSPRYQRTGDWEVPEFVWPQWDREKSLPLPEIELWLPMLYSVTLLAEVSCTFVEYSHSLIYALHKFQKNSLWQGTAWPSSAGEWQKHNFEENQPNRIFCPSSPAR
jgi:hypothetical protein